MNTRFRLHRPYFRSTKEAQPEEDPSVSARLQRLQNNYEDFGMRRTVEGILVVHDHGHPHILMLQIANAFFKLSVSHPPSSPRNIRLLTASIWTDQGIT
jgi:hypothetical protein